MKKPLPVGIDNFQKMRLQGYYYVDKSLLNKIAARWPAEAMAQFYFSNK